MIKGVRYRLTLAIASLLVIGLSMFLQTRQALPLALIVVFVAVGIVGFLWYSITLIVHLMRR